MNMNKAIFLDRDGTINVEKDYLYRVEDFEFLPGVIEALQLLQSAGFLLIMITNQSGIARGFYNEEDFQILCQWMTNVLDKKSIKIQRIYYCPHHPEAAVPEYRMDCSCRKPGLGLFHQAINDFDLDLKSCYAIGDKIRDVAICSEGAKGFLIGNNEKPETIEKVLHEEIRNVRYAVNLFAAAKKLCSEI